VRRDAAVVCSKPAPNESFAQGDIWKNEGSIKLRPMCLQESGFLFAGGVVSGSAMRRVAYWRGSPAGRWGGALGGGSGVAAPATDSPVLARALRAGREAFDRGDFASAAKQWEQAVQLAQKTHATATEVTAEVNLAAAYQSLGQSRLAIRTLQEAVDRATEF